MFAAGEEPSGERVNSKELNLLRRYSSLRPNECLNDESEEEDIDLVSFCWRLVPSEAFGVCCVWPLVWSRRSVLVLFFKISFDGVSKRGSCVVPCQSPIVYVYHRWLLELKACSPEASLFEEVGCSLFFSILLPVSINSIFVEVMLVLQFSFSLFLFLVVLERVESVLVQTFVSWL
ncbi:hypothetical protein Bca4012_032647 [Brassica carinata]